MCLAVPALITEILEDNMARASVGGAVHTLSLSLIEDAKVGDYVIAHVGYALSKIDPEEARKTLALFDEFNAAGGAARA
ncbi:MAG: HypC/HybG/HupF family hydrogenase formation chaperone [Patescibacteria group bacterium]